MLAPPGKFSWYDVMTAAKFHGDVISWSAQ